jgi:hypothetical protein
LNTKASKDDGTRSTINERIATLRGFFDKNTYLQVTATPQALFLQAPTHDFRPQFTVLSHPGSDYVGGEDFFAEDSPLVREFDINDITMLASGTQPTPGLHIPDSLQEALDTFLVGATYKRTHDPNGNCAFLCHVSTKTSDHRHIVALLRKYQRDLVAGLNAKNPALVTRLRSAFEDLSQTDERLAKSDFTTLIGAIEFFAPGTTVKLVNGETDEDVAVDTPYNLFVGGNKLGRGVTIKNLLVSYYGRNPRTPQADTVLQHARMYGYRRKDIGLLRLFLPNQLRMVFSAINTMEGGLRQLIERRPSEEFRGILLRTGLSATRRNVLAPGAVGIYAAGSIYNPAQVVRDSRVRAATAAIDEALAHVVDKSFVELPLERLKELVARVIPDETESEFVWNTVAIGESLTHWGELTGQETGYVWVDRNRDLRQRRFETQGILSGGETGTVPRDKATLFLLRTVAWEGNEPAWWPQVRLPDGQYAFAFSV